MVVYLSFTASSEALRTVSESSVGESCEVCTHINPHTTVHEQSKPISSHSGNFFSSSFFESFTMRSAIAIKAASHIKFARMSSL